ncbi:MAG: glucose-1-phosphate thymidylyltransferase [Firmicutes bacterium]|nr:glucose-1-phosphate thymidylyltransferase [Bacillota bacterium]
MKGLILSGGTGSRLQPLTHTLPKQLIPIANRPVLCYIIDALQHAGIDEIGIIVSDKKELIKKKIEKEHLPGVKLTYIVQDAPLGLAHAVKTARPFLGKSDFVMVLGDNLFEEGLDKALKIFAEGRFDAVVFLIPVDEPQRFGVAEVKDGRIISLAEKPANPRSNLAIMGIYIFRETIFPAIDRISFSERGELEITDAIQQLINMGGRVAPYMFSGWWLDIGRPKDVLAANRMMLSSLSRKSKKGLFTERLSQNCFVTPSSLISGSILQGPLIIGENCRVADSYIGPFTSIGNGSFVEGSALEGSILLENVSIRRVEGIILNSIVGEETEISGRDSLQNGMKSKTFLLGAKSRIYL